MLIFSPVNIASMRSRSPLCVGQIEQQAHRLVSDAVLRVVEVDPLGLGGQPRPACRVAP
jgi:hypothetical protein